jgi:hypothetical protein
MFYIVWIVTAAVAVGVGIYAATRIDKHEDQG